MLRLVEAIPSALCRDWPCHSAGHVTSKDLENSAWRPEIAPCGDALLNISMPLLSI